MGSFIDLHIHSNFSDGKYSITELVDVAKSHDVSVMSITDHDDLRSIKEIKRINSDIKYIKGIELSSTTKINNSDKWLHILGYDIDEENDELNCRLNKQKQIRKEVNKQYLIDMIKQFNFINDGILYEIDCTRFIRFSRLINKYIENNEFTLEQIKILKDYLDKVKISYPGYDFSDKEAIRLIHNAGGIPVLAHPYQYRMDEKDEELLLRKLIEYGLEGVEVYHSGDTVEGFELQNQLASKYNLLTTVGSDFHTDEDDEINRVGIGVNNNLCKTECSLLKRINN